MKCKYCNEEFTPNARGKKKDYCNKEDCLRQARNEAQRKWYANKMQVLDGTKNRIIEQKEEKKVVYSSLDKAMTSLQTQDFSDVLQLARELGALRFKLSEEVKKCCEKQSLYDRHDQDFLHKIENFAKEDELYEDEVVECVKEHINKRQERRVVKDKEDMLRHLMQGIISNPNEYVVQTIKNRDNRKYHPRVKE